MNLLAFLLIVAGAAALGLAVFGGLTGYLDGRAERRDAARRNQAHRP